jgi:hypothetical protein
MPLMTTSAVTPTGADAMRFAIDLGSREIPCLVTGEALRHRDGDACDREGSFRRHRREIEDVARRKYDAGQTHVSGTVIVATHDLNPELFLKAAIR